MNNNRTKTLNKKKTFYYQDILNYIKNHNKDITTAKAETKIIYQKIIQEGSKQLTIVGETKWKKQIPNIDIKHIWKNTFYSYGQPFSNDLHYRLLHYSTKTNDYIHKCSNNNNPNCDHCGLKEDNLHLFTKCTRIQKIWKHCQPYLTKLTGKTHTPQQHLPTLNVKGTSKYIKKLTLTITQIIFYEIWQSRNNIKYDKITLNTKTITNKINKHIEIILNAQFKKHKIENTLTEFNESLNHSVLIMP